MKRIMILGPGNSGKSTLAAKLGAELDIPVHHLDRYAWKENWQEISMEEKANIHAKLIAEDTWIIEGGWSFIINDRYERADTIIYLDVPRHVSIRRWLVRIWKYRKTPRPDMGGNNKEVLDREYFGWLIKHEYKNPERRQKLLAFAKDKNVYILETSKAVAQFLAKI